MDVERISAQVAERVDDVTRSWAPDVLRIGAALLWLSNVSWKVPPDFGRSNGGCRGLCAYVGAGIDHPVLPGSAWLFEHVISPNLVLFGWVTILSEALLAAMLLSGRFLRTASLLGIAQSLGILVSVGNADGEWYWSYLLMMLLHVGVLATSDHRRTQPERAMAWIAIAYGIVVAAAHGGAGFGGDGNGSWSLFGQRNDLPGDFGRNVFPGSIALGAIFVALGVGALVAHSKLSVRARRPGGWVLCALGLVLLVTVDADGLALGLGSRSTTACVLIAIGLAVGFADVAAADDSESAPSMPAATPS